MSVCIGCVDGYELDDDHTCSEIQTYFISARNLVLLTEFGLIIYGFICIGLFTWNQIRDKKAETEEAFAKQIEYDPPNQDDNSLSGLVNQIKIKSFEPHVCFVDPEDA